jgi:hypothetical protein
MSTGKLIAKTTAIDDTRLYTPLKYNSDGGKKTRAAGMHGKYSLFMN